MAFHVHHELLLGFLVIVGSLSHCLAASNDYMHKPGDYGAISLNRSNFPPGFRLLISMKVQQMKMVKGQVHGIASLTKIQEDVGITKEIGLDAYRLSISWPRILPKGKLEGGINKEGVRYYNNLINELQAHGIQPFVTLFHFDLPQPLEEEYDGFLSTHVADDFRDFVDVCFEEFGDQVKHWITLNEPWSFCNFSYATGMAAPGRCSEWQMLNCMGGGGSGMEPYIATHYQILTHDAAVKLYREKYRVASQKGIIGIALVSGWFVPCSNAKHNKNATLRALDFNLGWFLEPITNGDYPGSMRALVGSRLPKFTKEQSLIVIGSFDFLGLNYYTSSYVKYAPRSNSPKSYLTDALVNQTTERDGVPIGPQHCYYRLLPVFFGSNASGWLYVYPRGIRSLLLNIKQKYNNPIIYITENGIDEFNNLTLRLQQQLSDYTRIDYHYRHLSYLREVIKDGVKVEGYFAWSLFDYFEWASGYTVRFGINYVDYQNGLKRIPKRSKYWFKSFLKKY